MMQLDQNKQPLMYANYKEDIIIYVHDAEGNILTTDVDGEAIPVIDTVISGYTAPEAFEANISFNSGDTTLAEFGLDTSDYNAIISANKGELPFDERTLIWHKATPEYDSKGEVIPESADYRVKAVKTSLNEERFILKKYVNDGAKTTPSG